MRLNVFVKIFILIKKVTVIKSQSELCQGKRKSGNYGQFQADDRLYLKQTKVKSKTNIFLTKLIRFV